MDNNTGKKQDTIASLFTDGELKELFKKFLVLIGGIEVFIFFACWIYQLGINEFDRFGPVNIPFPWKIYFTVAFLAPVAVIFLLGLFVVAFNRYIYGTKPSEDDDSEESKGAKKITTLMNEMLQLPFLFSLLLLGAGVLVMYRINDIAGFIARLGIESFHFFRILSFVGIAVLTIFGLVWMVMKYRLRQKEMDYQYKETVMRQLGVLVEEEGSVVRIQDLLPQLPSSEDPPDQGSAPPIEVSAPKDAANGQTFDIEGDLYPCDQQVLDNPEDLVEEAHRVRTMPGDVSTEGPLFSDMAEGIPREEDAIMAKG